MMRSVLSPRRPPASASISAWNGAGPQWSSVIWLCARASAWMRPSTTLTNSLHGVVVGLRLADQAADHAEDVAHPVVELGDQQFLPRARLLALGRGLVGQPQHDLDQGRAQRFGDAKFGRGEGLASGLRPVPSTPQSFRAASGAGRWGHSSTGLCGSPAQRTESDQLASGTARHSRAASARSGSRAGRRRTEAKLLGARAPASRCGRSRRPCRRRCR